MNHWTHAARFYYGAGAEPPRNPGGLAIETRHKGHSSLQIEVLAGKIRKDIGRIEVRDLSTGEPWQVVQYVHDAVGMP